MSLPDVHLLTTGGQHGKQSSWCARPHDLPDTTQAWSNVPDAAKSDLGRFSQPDPVHARPGCGMPVQLLPVRGFTAPTHNF